eukprot:12117972-Alexandrium_andersonii.AAC.1
MATAIPPCFEVCVACECPNGATLDVVSEVLECEWHAGFMPDAALVTAGKGPPTALTVCRDLVPGELASKAGCSHGLAEPQLLCSPRGSWRLQARGPGWGL